MSSDYDKKYKKAAGDLADTLKATPLSDMEIAQKMLNHVQMISKNADMLGDKDRNNSRHASRRHFTHEIDSIRRSGYGDRATRGYHESLRTRENILEDINRNSSSSNYDNDAMKLKRSADATYKVYAEKFKTGDLTSQDVKSLYGIVQGLDNRYKKIAEEFGHITDPDQTIASLMSHGIRSRSHYESLGIQDYEGYDFQKDNLDLAMAQYEYRYGAEKSLHNGLESYENAHPEILEPSEPSNKYPPKQHEYKSGSKYDTTAESKAKPPTLEANKRIHTYAFDASTKNKIPGTTFEHLPGGMRNIAMKHDCSVVGFKENSIQNINPQKRDFLNPEENAYDEVTLQYTGHSLADNFIHQRIIGANLNATEAKNANTFEYDVSEGTPLFKFDEDTSAVRMQTIVKSGDDYYSINCHNIDKIREWQKDGSLDDKIAQASDDKGGIYAVKLTGDLLPHSIGIHSGAVPEPTSSSDRLTNKFNNQNPDGFNPNSIINKPEMSAPAPAHDHQFTTV